MIHYMIVHASEYNHKDAIAKCQKLVEEQLNNDYELVGGLSIACQPATEDTLPLTICTQAMILKVAEYYYE